MKFAFRLSLGGTGMEFPTLEDAIKSRENEEWMEGDDEKTETIVTFRYLDGRPINHAIVTYYRDFNGTINHYSTILEG